MCLLQRAPRPDRPQRVSAAAEEAEQHYPPFGDGDPRLDDQEGFDQGDDEEEPAFEVAEGVAPGTCAFSAPTRDFPADPRVVAAPPGSEMHWDPELRCFGKPPATASDYDYFMHFFDHDFFKNGLLAHTQAHSPSLLITENELWTFLALRMIMACHPSIAVIDFFTPHAVSLTKPAPFLGDYMTPTRFKEINSALRTAPASAGGPPDKFYLVRKMLESWQHHSQRHSSATRSVPGGWGPGHYRPCFGACCRSQAAVV
jgi:hypothetical protein